MLELLTSGKIITYIESKFSHYFVLLQSKEFEFQVWKARYWAIQGKKQRCQMLYCITLH